MSAERLRGLVERWRLPSNAPAFTSEQAEYFNGRDAAYSSCADELEQAMGEMAKIDPIIPVNRLRTLTEQCKPGYVFTMAFRREEAAALLAALGENRE